MSGSFNFWLNSFSNNSLGGDLNSLEELLSLEDLKTFQRHFLKAIKDKQDNLLKEKDFQITTKNRKNYGLLVIYLNLN